MQAAALKVEAHEWAWKDGKKMVKYNVRIIYKREHEDVYVVKCDNEQLAREKAIALYQDFLGFTEVEVLDVEEN